MVNLDTVTSLAFIAEGSSVRYQLRIYVQEQQMVMTQTALDEFMGIVQRVGGQSEQDRASRFMQRVTEKLGLKPRPGRATFFWFLA